MDQAPPARAVGNVSEGYGFSLASISLKNQVGQDHEPALSILYIPVPHSGHFPFIAGRPFFIVTRSVSFMTLFALHFTQYASSIVTSTLLVDS